MCVLKGRPGVEALRTSEVETQAEGVPYASCKVGDCATLVAQLELEPEEDIRVARPIRNREAPVTSRS